MPTSDADHQGHPRAVTWASGLWILGTAVGLVSAVLLFSAVPSPGHLLAVPASHSERAAGIGVLLAAWSLARLVFAWFMLRGHVWARTVLTALAGLGLAVITFHFGYVTALNCIAAAINVVAVVLQFLPSSNAYFSRCYHRTHAPFDAPEQPLRPSERPAQI
ncbi:MULTISPECIES: hypothetical protein [unclassified Microbacterium]|uniref:hypothetical protein n=1 Tax=unclassified Microbacterium TaxID=2609290 RepID=UPI00214B74A7|nr:MULTISPECIES: hypothetical protein [unclassified Microbacterium]MCR2809692.1 hypothetical protein [Microbacterium sp. zg.B185]WIM17990.1 hypothetical protein QNO12_10230 [Microbacterium sp. zg-B185]